MTKNYLSWIGIGLFVLAFVGLFVLNVFIHEDVHKQVQEYFGCTDSIVHYGIFSAFTVCNYYVDRSQDTVNLEYSLHAENEILSYNLYTLYGVLFLCTGVIVAVLLVRKYE